MALEIVKTTKETRLLQERFWPSLQERKRPRRRLAREPRSWPPERQRKKKFLKIEKSREDHQRIRLWETCPGREAKKLRCLLF